MSFRDTFSQASEADGGGWESDSDQGLDPAERRRRKWAEKQPMHRAPLKTESLPVEATDDEVEVLETEPDVPEFPLDDPYYDRYVQALEGQDCGPPVPDTVHTLMKNAFTKGLAKFKHPEHLKEIGGKLARPQNFDVLGKIPRTNKILWQAMSRNGRTRDLMFQNVQTPLLWATTALIRIFANSNLPDEIRDLAADGIDAAAIAYGVCHDGRKTNLKLSVSPAIRDALSGDQIRAVTFGEKWIALSDAELKTQVVAAIRNDNTLRYVDRVARYRSGSSQGSNFLRGGFRRTGRPGFHPYQDSREDDSREERFLADGPAPRLPRPAPPGRRGFHGNHRSRPHRGNQPGYRRPHRGGRW